MLLSEIAEYLDTQGVVTYDPTGVSGNTFVDVMPESPDDAVAIYNGTGQTADGKLGYDLPAVEFLIRGTQDPRPAEQLAQDIYNELHGFHHGYFVAGQTYVINCIAAQPPFHMGRDGNGRHEYKINFNLETRNITKHRE